MTGLLKWGRRGDLVIWRAALRRSRNQARRSRVRATAGRGRRGIVGGITRQRDIIDRRALAAELSAAARSVKTSSFDRAPMVAPLKAALAAGRAEIRRRFEAAGDGTAVVREECFLMDQLIRALFDVVTGEIYPLPNPTSGERLALVAVGGYGRGELAPYSDIDLLFLLPYKQTPHTEQVVELLLYLLWDLGLKIGQSTRSVEECLRQAKSDLTIRTGLLEARYLWGDAGVVRRAQKALRRRNRARHRGAIRRGQARRARRAAPPGRRQPLPARAQRQGRQGRPQRPAHPVLAGQIHLPHRRRGQARRARRAVGRGVAALRPRAELSVECALPPAFPRRPRRGAADLRPAERDRAAHGLHRPRRQPRRRALHEALFSGRQGCRRPDPDLLRDPRSRSEAQAAAFLGALGQRPARARRVRARWRAADDPVRGFLQERSGGAAAPVPCRPAAAGSTSIRARCAAPANACG